VRVEGPPSKKKGGAEGAVGLCPKATRLITRPTAEMPTGIRSLGRGRVSYKGQRQETCADGGRRKMKLNVRTVIKREHRVLSNVGEKLHLRSHARKDECKKRAIDARQARSIRGVQDKD